MTEPAPLISAEESAQRKKAVDFARGSVRFEGFILSPETEALNARFIAGELTEAEQSAAILRRWLPLADDRSDTGGNDG